MQSVLRWALSVASVGGLVLACGSSGSGGGGGFGSSSGSGGPSSSGGSSGGVASSGGASSGVSSSGTGSGSSSGTVGGSSSGASSSSGAVGGSSGGSSSGPKDAGPPPWGGPSGPLTCSGTGKYDSNFPSGSYTCGTSRWDVKTGTDSASSSINLTPQLTTVANLLALPSQTTANGTPRLPSEMQTWALKDAYVNFIRFEEDGDYHMVLSDALAISGGNLTGPTLIGEIPYPGCVSGGPLACNISRARAAVDAQYTLAIDVGHDEKQVASLIGVSFFDFEHGQFGAASNNIELHAVVAICFGQGCDPTKD